MAMDRRTFLKASGAGGAVLLARPFLPLAGAGEPDAFPVARGSRLFADGTKVVHSDLHNHSLLSDGAGDPDAAYELMRAAGLDVAALTDHAIHGKAHGHLTCPSGDCTYAVGINRDSWERMRGLADAADDPGAFTAIRGFEWTSGHHGHINIWFTDHWTDPLESDGLVHPQGLGNFVANSGGPDLGDVFGQVPDLLSSMDGFYEWLHTPPEDGGGGDGLAGFNHPNSWGNFEDFRYEPAVHDQLVSCEILNGTTDFLFFGMDDGHPSPINACLNAGWRVGLLGTSDEHGTDYGLAGKARGGLWVSEWSREGVREALRARRFFATREAGLRVDAALNGVRMGGVVADLAGAVVHLDIAGPGWGGRDLNVQVLRPGTDRPVIAHAEDVTVPADDHPVISFAFDPPDPAEGDWVLLRVTDPNGEPDPLAPEPFAAYGRPVAYPSPFFLSGASTLMVDPSHI